MALGGPGRVSGCCHGRQLDGEIIADGRHGLKAHVAALDRPLAILFEQERAHEPGDSWSATARHCRCAASWSASANAVPIQAATMRRWVLPACAMAFLWKRTRQRWLVAPSTRFAAAFGPSWASDLTTKSSQGADRLDAPQAAAGQAAQELGPEVFRLRVADCHAEHLPPAVGVHRDRDDDRHADDPVIAPGFDVGGIEPQIRPLPLDGPVQKGADPLVGLGAEPGRLAFADTRVAHDPHQRVHVARR